VQKAQKILFNARKASDGEKMNVQHRTSNERTPILGTLATFPVYPDSGGKR